MNEIAQTRDEAQTQCTARCAHGGRCSRFAVSGVRPELCGNHHRQHRRLQDAEKRASRGGPYDAKTFGPDETAKQAREMIAKLCDLHLTAPIRSLPTLTVRDHYAILESIKEAAIGGLGFM